MTSGRFDWVRLTLRLHRFELFSFGVAIIGLVIGGFVASAYVDSLRPPSECLTFSDSPVDCEVARRKFQDAQVFVSLITTPLVIVTFTVGLFLGVPVIARELERGTVRLAWWLTPSRWRWYLARLLPMLAVVVVLVVGAGLAMDRMFAANTPGVDMSKSFDGYGIRGGLLASQEIFVFAVSVFVGSFIGRSLPAVIIAALVATIGLYGGTQVNDRILLSEAVIVPADQSENGGVQPGDKYLDQKFVLPDGTLVGYEYFGNESPYDQDGLPIYPQVALLIPGERYLFVVARQSAGLLVGSFVALLVAGFVVARRRPG